MSAIGSFQLNNVKLPNEMALAIFSNLSVQDLMSCAKVCKLWNVLAHDRSLLKQAFERVCELAFSHKDWMHHFKVMVGLPPSLTLRQCGEFLEGNCPFIHGEKLRDTHVLMLVPESINAEPLTLLKMGEVAKKNLRPQATAAEWNESGFGTIGETIRADYGSLPSGSSRWVLMTRFSVSAKDAETVTKALMHRTLMPEASANALTERLSCAPIASAVNFVVKGYTIPKALDAAVGIFAAFARNPGFVLNTYLTCQEKTSAGVVTIGDFTAESGLVLLGDMPEQSIAGCRVLSESAPEMLRLTN